MDRILMAALLTLALAGCGSSGDISGEVSFKGTHLAGGWVTLNYSDRKHPSLSGAIGPDGKFRISGCPAGDVRVTIRSKLGQGTKTNGNKATSIPVRYADPEKTDIVVTIFGGVQRLDLELKP
jgi:hypothetical protein